MDKVLYVIVTFDTDAISPKPVVQWANNERSLLHAISTASRIGLGFEVYKITGNDFGTPQLVGSGD